MVKDVVGKLINENFVYQTTNTVNPPNTENQRQYILGEVKQWSMEGRFWGYDCIPVPGPLSGLSSLPTLRACTCQDNGSEG